MQAQCRMNGTRVGTIEERYTLLLRAGSSYQCSLRVSTGTCSISMHMVQQRGISQQDMYKAACQSPESKVGQSGNRNGLPRPTDSDRTDRHTQPTVTNVLSRDMLNKPYQLRAGKDLKEFSRRLPPAPGSQRHRARERAQLLSRFQFQSDGYKSNPPRKQLCSLTECQSIGPR